MKKFLFNTFTKPTELIFNFKKSINVKPYTSSFSSSSYKAAWLYADWVELGKNLFLL